jgi:hypothetical protein
MTDQTTGDNGLEPTPSKRSIPRVAWIVVAICVVLLAAAAIYSATRLSGDPAAPTGPAASAPPSTAPSDTAEADPSADPSPFSEESSGSVSLDDAFVIGTSLPAIWQLPVVEGWEITTLDQEGVSVQTNETLGCTFTTVQNRQVPADADATSDRLETEATVESLHQGFLSQAPDAVITDTVGLAIPYGGLVSADDVVEFAGFRADYVRADNGEAWSSMFVARTMPRIEGMMYSVLNCATTTIDSDETIWRGMLDQTVVTAGD